MRLSYCLNTINFLSLAFLAKAFAPLPGLRVVPATALVRRASTTTSTTAPSVAAVDQQTEESVTQDEETTSSSLLQVATTTNTANDKNPIEDYVYRFLAAGGGPEEDIGARGEVYFGMQAVVIVTIALGVGVPFLSFLGFGLLATGVAVLFVTGLNLGDSVTPWPKPNGQGLVREGLYSQVRHPMYTGVLATVAGFSIWTDSLDRLLWTIVLYLAIEIKSDYEEDELRKMYPDYDDYCEEVETKFLPKGIFQLWKKNKSKEE